MNANKKDIVTILQDLKGSGEFAVTGNEEFMFPGLQVEGVGEVSFPVNMSQAEALIRMADKALFGKGNQTLYDEEVRRTREMDADKLTFRNPEWFGLINNFIKNIQGELGLLDYKIDARPYKLLIYQEGDFYLTHKVTEKEKGMFGALIVGLPSNYSGGELCIRFEGEELEADFARNNPEYSINYATFYADYDHEVKPRTSGYRFVERNINCVSIDLKMETFRKGSPHTLRLTETKAAYHRAMKI